MASKSRNDVSLANDLKKAKAAGVGAGAPWLKNSGISVLPDLSAGRHTARLDKISFSRSSRFPGFTVQMEWISVQGGGSSFLLMISEESRMEWLTKKNVTLVNSVLQAAGLASSRSPNWSEIPKILGSTWFSIDLKVNSKGFLNLNSLEVFGHATPEAWDECDQDSSEEPGIDIAEKDLNDYEE